MILYIQMQIVNTIKSTMKKTSNITVQNTHIVVITSEKMIV